jgi:hypothetical protein
MPETDPIDVGATFALDTEVGRVESRAVNMYVDEDGITHVRLEYGSDRAGAIMGRLHETLTVEDLRSKMLADEMHRTNSGKDAFEWRRD